jgi:carbamoyltransferase
MPRTLGIHIGHDGGGAIASEGEIIVACAEERLTRRKYSNGWWLSLQYCLDAAHLTLQDIDLVVFSNAGVPLQAGYDGGLAKWTTADLNVINVDHHISHAVGAFSFSSFENSLVFVGDAGGNSGMTESAYLFDRTGFEKVSESPPERPRCKGLGTTYEAFTNFLGFSDEESGKTMALAAYGDHERLDSIDLFHVDKEGRIWGVLESTHQRGIRHLSESKGLFLGRDFPESGISLAADAAAWIQTSFERAQWRAVSILLAKHNSSNLCLGGGTALNCTANSRLRRRLQPGGLFAFPAASDTGLAIGNAIYGQWMLEGRFPHPQNRTMRFGLSYSNNDILRALRREPDVTPPGSVRNGSPRWSRCSDVAELAAQLIVEGKIVCWWQQNGESGPRALGGRSILASPSATGVRERLNTQIKRREWFRPFGPSVLYEDASIYLEESGLDLPYMIEAPAASTVGQQVLSECVHVDGSTRIQMVHESSDPYFQLLRAMKQKTGHGAVLNTSFNVQGPIVETPGDAMETFLSTNADALILGDYVVFRDADALSRG